MRAAALILEFGEAGAVRLVVEVAGVELPYRLMGVMVGVNVFV